MTCASSTPGRTAPLRQLHQAERALATEGQTLGFAMNAGMYHRDLAPVGLYDRERDRAGTRIVTSDGPGNFGLLPNGVFCIGETFRVIESRSLCRRCARTAALPPSPGRCW